MNFAQLFLATVTLIVVSISPTFANEKVEIVDKIGYGGSGCPDGSANVSVSPDGQELRFLFDKFIAQGNGKPEEKRKSCALAVPIGIPQGKQIAIYDADYRGYVAPNTTGTLRTEYYYTGGGSTKFIDELKGEKNYDVHHNLEGEVWSACGKSVIMRINTSMVAKGEGIATVDSLDLDGRGWIYHLKYRNCQ